MRLILLGVFKYAKKKGYTNLSISEFNNELELSKKIFKKRKITAEEKSKQINPYTGEVVKVY